MKTYKFANFHEVEAAAVFCIDPRFWAQTIDFIQNELGIKTFDPYTYPGGPLCLARSETRDIYLNNLKLASLELHHAKKIILITHENCGGYRLCEHVEGEEAICKQKDDLTAIEKILQEKFPDIPVENYLLKIVSDDQITFEKL